MPRGDRRARRRLPAGSRPDRAAAWRLPAAAAAGVLAAEACTGGAPTARLGGVTGDVMGAVGEAATTVALLVAAALF